MHECMHRPRLMLPGFSSVSRLRRWSLEAQAGRLDGALPVQFGVFLPGVDRFDSSAFAVSAPEAALLDPQQRLLLHGKLLTATLQSLRTARPQPTTFQP